MRYPPHPISGPLNIDCGSMAAQEAVRKLEDTLKQVRPGARMVTLKLGGDEVSGAIERWARARKFRFSQAEGVVQLFLLPAEFGAHPIASRARPGLSQPMLEMLAEAGA